MFSRMVPFILLVILGACAPVDPVGGGQIHTRCVADGGSTLSPRCGENQYVLCLLGTDAGNGQSQARCCNNDETESSCLQRSGLVPADAGRAPANDR